MEDSIRTDDGHTSEAWGSEQLGRFACIADEDGVVVGAVSSRYSQKSPSKECGERGKNVSTVRKCAGNGEDLLDLSHERKVCSETLSRLKCHAKGLGPMTVRRLSTKKKRCFLRGLKDKEVTHMSGEETLYVL